MQRIRKETTSFLDARKTEFRFETEPFYRFLIIFNGVDDLKRFEPVTLEVKKGRET